jgi:D-glucosaminate-6-phosphate ammonia-lyase
MMQPGDDKVVAERLVEVLSRKRSGKPVPAAPAANITGRWDVEVTFFSSKSQHTLTLEQNGNQLRGSHKGDFSLQDVFGAIESDQIKLQSADHKPGDSITFTFSGSLSGDTFSGPVYMGEYLNAKFTAKRHTYPDRRGTILIPGGPPLAN